ncbi:hypothetical protein [Agromyces archimandritae]|uniref:Uncharacterized protein n=1 Tax=Agromyces archimandritae TaxID=2781962 RepID=A0A975FKQ3_9MICO|nr:hypothetical protein [Agromyces archimandritae]QTX04305.1 hypothetical protein G127AT_13650 [Agromyces archimandritae]
MAAQFLRLKLHLLANIFRRSAWQITGIVLGLVYGLTAAIVLFGVLAGLRFVPEIEFVRDLITVAGSVTMLGFALFPLLFGSEDTMDPRRFALFGIPNRRLSFGIALSSLIGIPAFVLAIVLVGMIITWTRDVGSTILAVIAAALALAGCLLVARVASSFAAFLLDTRRAKELSGFLGLLLVVAISPVVIALSSVDWARSGHLVLERFSSVLGWTPLGAVWAVPGDAAAGSWGTALAKLLVAIASIGLLWLVWERLVAKMLVTPGRETAAKSYAGLGWFDRMPAGRTGAVAARAITYWVRDARYWVSIVMVPIVPIAVLIPLAIAGVPGDLLALVPVPLMCLFLGWGLHNDTAYDSTAIWLHVASGVPGRADRLGRVVPVLGLGVIAIVVGSAVTVAVTQDWAPLPALIGVSTVLLLAGLGIGSVTSARFPYPAVKPGDSPFQQPQSTGAITALVQTFTLFGSFVLALPAIVFAVMGLLVDPAWNAAALISGLVVGVAALGIGVSWGGRIFEHREPEIMLAAVRA